MIGAYDTYYSRPEISNSDLSWLQSYFMNREQLHDLTEAYRFGNLIDALITEPNRCDHMRFRVDQEQFTALEWDCARKMLKAFREDEFCMQLLKHSSGQSVVARMMMMQYEGVDFELPCRCKFDLKSDVLKISADIKSTVCVTADQFRNSIQYFNYDKQAAFYMDLAEVDRFLFIGISKKNFKIFKVPVVRGDALYNSGKEKYTEWAFKYWYLFEGF